MKISIICVGKIKEKYWNMAIDEYFKRLKIYATIEIIEVLEEKVPENMSETQLKIAKEKEGERILKHIKANPFVVALDLNGDALSSKEFSKFFEDNMLKGISHIYFIIGGSVGVGDNVLKICNKKISFSKMTFPHQMFRVILLEQIYRAFKISKNEPYHK